jgi:LytTR family transcriptional regulator, CO-responsive transcriptional regulator RcoM
MDNKIAGNSDLYLFEKLDVGVIQLDADRKVVAMNDLARRILPVDRMKPFDRFVLDFHPERSRPKVNFLIDQASTCPVAQNVPMTMIINVPEQILLIKVTRLTNMQQQLSGFVLVFYDVTSIVSAEEPVLQASASSRRLSRLPVAMGNQVCFLDVQQVCVVASDGHYCRILSADGWHFCNLSMGDLQERLDPELFVRVHRRYLVNLGTIDSLHRDGVKTSLQFSHHPEFRVPVSRAIASKLKKQLQLR